MHVIDISSAPNVPRLMLLSTFIKKHIWTAITASLCGACTTATTVPEVGGRTPNYTVHEGDYIRLGPSASVRATLRSNVAATTFSISGVSSGHDLELPATNVANVVFPIAGVTVTARAECYRDLDSYVQVTKDDDGRDYSFVFSNVYRKPECVEGPQQPTFAGTAQNLATEKLAWLIASSRYESNWPALQFVKGDQANMTAVFRRAGYRVVTSFDRSHAELITDEASVVRLLAQQKWSAVVIYVSGHGEGLAGQNYFVPSDAPESTIAKAPDLFSISRLQEDLHPVSASGTFSVVLVDACRSGASAPRMFVPSDQSVLVNFSTAPGDSAYNGDHEMSAWTERFVAIAGRYPSLGIDQLIMYANRYTKWQTAMTSQPQVPVLYGQLPSRIPTFGEPTTGNTLDEPVVAILEQDAL